MERLLVGERNIEHRSVLKEVFGKLAPSLIVDFAGNGEDILHYLDEHAPSRQPILIVLEPSLPAVFPGSLVHVIKADTRFSNIPIVILASQAGTDYYTLRSAGLVSLSFIKPSTPNGWELLAKRILDVAGPRTSSFTP